MQYKRFVEDDFKVKIPLVVSSIDFSPKIIRDKLEFVYFEIKL